MVFDADEERVRPYAPAGWHDFYVEGHRYVACRDGCRKRGESAIADDLVALLERTAESAKAWRDARRTV